jgi:DNA-binding beta-propeller fold protein YncE
LVSLELPDGRLVARASIPEGFYGLAFSADGKTVFCSGAGREVVHSFAFADGYFSQHEEIKLREDIKRGIPGGIAVTEDGKTLYVANVWAHSISEVQLANSVLLEIPLGTNNTNVATQPVPLPSPGPSASTSTNAASASEDEAAITKRAEAWLDETRPDDPFPYTCLLDEKRSRLYVSLWSQSRVAVIDLTTREVIARWEVEEHPNELALSKSGEHLFVANANRNTVSVLETATGKVVETLSALLKADSPPGSTPNSLALSPDGKHLFVANANINAVAVFDVSTPGKSHSLGFIPVGWYPTSIRVTENGKKLLVANGKGLISKSNRNGPQPGETAPATVREYIAGLLQGTVSIIDLPSAEKFSQQMQTHTAKAYQCLPKPEKQTIGAGMFPDNPIPRRLGLASPIKYCIYIIKENRTYDQVLGDMPEGNGDPAICLFPEKITPNHHKIAREFVLLDNFYVEGEVSADGHEWTMGAYATDFVEKTWPLSYGHNKHKKFPYPAEGNFDIAIPAGGYLWDRAKEAGVTYRSYGEFIRNGKTTNDPGTARVTALKDHFDPWYRGFDMEYSDVRRADRFISELKRFEAEGQMPRLQILRLPNDHTSGTTTNRPTPRAAVADNDLALGRVVEALSESKFWPELAIFVVEDDAQNGPDHVDAHRTIAFVISPYTKRKFIDSTMYSTASMLRTMELILGLRPMSQFDAAAAPMSHSFTHLANYESYKSVVPAVKLNEMNPKTAWGSAASRKMDFTKEDAADDLLLNEIIWRSIKGADHPMPAPRRAAFFRASAKDDDD